MKTIYSILVFTLLNLSFVSAQNFHDEEVDILNAKLSDCIENNPTTHGNISCIDASMKEWDKFLNKYYKLLKAELSAEGKQKLLETQIEWIKMRDKEYSFIDQYYHVETGGGTMFQSIALNAKLDIIIARAIQLKKYYVDINDYR